MLADLGVDVTATVTDPSVRGGGRGSSAHAVVDGEFNDEFGLTHESSGMI